MAIINRTIIYTSNIIYPDDFSSVMIWELKQEIPIYHLIKNKLIHLTTLKDINADEIAEIYVNDYLDNNGDSNRNDHLIQI